jgi:hypothetical protein
MRRKNKTNVSEAYGIIKGFTLFTLFLSVTLFTKTFAQISPVSPPNGSFKIDGALRANVGSQAGDWVPRLNGQAFTSGVDSFVLSSSGVPKDNVTTRLKRDLYNSSSDSVFAQGSKFNDYIGALHWTTGTAPDKNDINNGVFHAAGDGSGNQWVFIGGDRLAVNGTSYIDFEFLQGTVTVNSNGTFTGSGPNGGRYEGDINISMEYNNGGTAPKVVIYRWKILSGTTYGWDSTGSAAITDAYAQTNLATVDVPFTAFGLGTYQPYAFVEAAINITQLINSGSVGGNCGGLSIKTLWIKTKAASTSTAALKDFMSPISLDLNFGGVNIDQKGPVCANGGNLTLTGTPAGGTFSGPGVTGSTFNPSTAGAGTHQIIYTASAGANCIKKDTMYIVVNALPTAGISGPGPVCKNATSPFVVLTGSGGTRPYTFSYNIDGGSTLTKTTTGSFDTVKIAVPTGSSGSITYNLTGIADANCSNTATGNAVVTINPLPTASAGTAPASQCYNVNGNSFNLSGSGTNGNASWAVQSNPNSLTVQILNGTTFTPTINVSGSSTGGSVTLRLTVTSNTSPQCGTATDDVIVTVNGQASGPSVTYIPPTCLETTFSITVDNPHGGSTYTLRQLSGGVGPVTKSGTSDVVAGKITFSGLTIGKGYRVTETTSSNCVSAPTSCGDFSSVSGARTQQVQNNVPSELVSDPKVNAYPNPFNDRIKFVVNSPNAGNGSLEVYNLLGQKVKTVYQGYINIGDQSFELNIPKKQQATLIYVFKVAGKQVTGKILQLNN